MEQIDSLLEKYDHFKDAQIRSIQQPSDTSAIVTIVVQDDDGEDINTITLEFDQIKESRILVDHVLPFLDMMGGISLINENDFYGFGVGSGSAMLNIHNAPMFIIASELSIEDK